MKEQDEKLNNMLSSIYSTASEQSTVINNRIEEERRLRLKKAENELLAEAYHRIRLEVSAIRTREARRVSDTFNNFRRSLYARREEIARETMEDVRKKLLGFTASASYGESLAVLAENASKKLGMGPAIIHMRNCDLHLSRCIAQFFAQGSEFIADDEIRLGGIIISSAEGRRRIDCSYDSVFSELSSRFASLVSFTIT